MATIRDVVRALRSRTGVDGVLVMGSDGLPIDSSVSNGCDPEMLAALVPSVIDACGKAGQAGSRGAFRLGVFEYEQGFLIVNHLTADSLLAVLVQAETNLGELLFEMRRYRQAMAGLL